MMKILYLAFMKLGNVRYAATMCSVLQCKLCDTLVPPILSCGFEVWGMKSSLGEAAEVLHRSFLKF